jgi:hypothetical protein
MSSKRLAIAPMSVFVERRRVLRRRVTYGRARIVWRQSPSLYHKSPAWLLDISEKGARVLSAHDPRRQEFLWVGLNCLPMEWVKANIRGIGLQGLRWDYHLEFCETCAPGLIEGATRAAYDEMFLY